MAKRKPDGLAQYRAKRDFKVTPEPAGKRAPKTAARQFCVQKHLSRSLHYDLRLEHNGALLSWAVPKGPSLNPKDKRFAARTEEHPLEYVDFEDVIPEGYGAGIMMLWDRGTWEPESPDVDVALKKGDLKFKLNGVKLKGSWVLVRTKHADNAKEQWLLIKHRDQWSGDIDLMSFAPNSVESFGDFADILRSKGIPGAWRKQLPVKGGETGKRLREIIRGADASPESDADVARGGKARKLPAPALKLGTNRPKLTNLTKQLYPSGFTKQDVVDYYQRVAPLILPHLAGRAVTLKRYPDGVNGEAFFHKRCPAHRPPWVKTARVVSESGEAIDYCAIDDLGTLLWVANLAALELHVPLAHADAPDRPTAMVFDLDPGEPAGLPECFEVARRLTELLEQVKLKSFAKLSGKKGLHMLVPLNTTSVTFDQTKTFARAVAQTLSRDDPKRVTSVMKKDQRSGKVFIDWSQNDRAKTTVCVYSLRAAPAPTISWPVDLARTVTASPRADEIRLPARDLFAQVTSTVQSLPSIA